MYNTWVSYVGSHFGNNILMFKRVFSEQLYSHLIFLRFEKKFKRNINYLDFYLNNEITILF